MTASTNPDAAGSARVATGGAGAPRPQPLVDDVIQAIGDGAVDALFVADASGRRLITLNGADRAYRLLVEDMADGAVTLTPDGVVAWCNRSFAALAGRPLNRLIGTPVALCFAPEARAGLAVLLAEGQHRPRSRAMDLLPDGGVRLPTYLSVNPSVVDGLPEALCMVVTDLTEQRRSEAEKLSRQHLLDVIETQQRTQQRLEESLAELRLRNRALGAISQGVVITDAGRRITYTNAAFEAMSGYAAAEMLGRSCGLLQGAQTDATVVQAMRRAFDARLPYHGEVLNYRKDGTPFWNDLSVTPVFGPEGDLAQFVGVQRDISELRVTAAARQSLEAQLREAQKMEAIGTLAGGIAHDFNNILGSMLGNLGLAREALPAEHPAWTLLDQVGVAGRRARSLVEQILAFSRRQPTTLRAQALEPIVREAVGLLRATLPATARLALVLGTGASSLIRCDATQLQQIVINLCTNAWQALPGGTGRIVVSVGATRIGPGAAEPDAPGPPPGEYVHLAGGPPPGDYVHLAVSDTGHGMDPGTQARIFEPFFSTKPLGRGTGPGLSVVHGIVASHGGHIAVHSRACGGTVFDLYFPATDSPEDGSVPKALPAEPARGRGQHVMVIDDDEVVLLMVGRLLESLGYRATCFADPVAALERFAAAPGDFDAVVTDYNMPQMSGLAVAQALRRSDARLPIAISSGFIPEALRTAAAAHGVNEVMRKEHTLEDLGALLGRLLG